MPVAILRPLDGMAQPVPAESLDEFNRKADRQIYFADSSRELIVEQVQRKLMDEKKT